MNIIIETRFVPEEFVPVHEVFVVSEHDKGTLKIKLARLYMEGLQDSAALKLELPESLSKFVEFVKDKLENDRESK